MVPLTPVRTGPQLLEVVAQADDGEQRQSFVLTVLPRRLGGPDTFYGLGCYDSADLVSGRFGMELGLLRVAGADWTLFWLAGRPTEPTAAGTDPLRFAEAMTLGLGPSSSAPWPMWRPRPPVASPATCPAI